MPATARRVPRRSKRRRERGPRRRRAKIPAFGVDRSRSSRRSSTSVPTRGDVVYEIKYDGYRALARLDEGEVRMASRQRDDWTERIPGSPRRSSRVRAKTRDLRRRDRLRAARTGAPTSRSSRTRSASAPSAGAPRLLRLRSAPLRRRRPARRSRSRSARRSCAPSSPARARRCKLSDHVAATARRSSRRPASSGSKGSSPSAPIGRIAPGADPDWVKIKCQQRQELVIGGYTDPKGARSGLGALLLGVARTAKLRTPARSAPASRTRRCAICTKRLGRLERATSPGRGRVRACATRAG